MKLVYCQKCRNPVAKLKPGSAAEVKCHRCNTRTYFEVPAEPVAEKQAA